MIVAFASSARFMAVPAVDCAALAIFSSSSNFLSMCLICVVKFAMDPNAEFATRNLTYSAEIAG